MQKLNRYDLQFCLRRAPKPVLELLKANPRTSCIAGGFIRAVVAGETVNDVDIFASSPQHAQNMAAFLAAYGVRDGEPRRKVITTDNAYTIRGFRIDPQIVHRWTFSDIADVVPSFDFTIACAAIFWCNRNNRWDSLIDPNFYADLAAKRLVYRSPDRNEDAGGSMLRVLKFYQRGYRIPLDSFGAVMARMCQGQRAETFLGPEKDLAACFTRLLREVDPAVDPDHIAHLPSLAEEHE